FYQKYPMTTLQNAPGKKLLSVTFKPTENRAVSLVISDRDKEDFLTNLSISRLSINQLKKNYAVDMPVSSDFRRSNAYAKLSNYFFRNYSEQLVAKGYFATLNRNLRKMSSGFILATYVSMIFFTTLLTFFISLFLFIFLLFFEVSLVFPFFTASQDLLLMRFLKFSWIILLVPLTSGLLFYFYPMSEVRNLGYRMNQELPFVTIHMSAIASSGVNPVNVFEIMMKSGEYKYTTVAFKKLLNLVNFQGEDIVSALRKVSVLSPSPKLSELFNGLAFTIKSGGELHRFLNKHAENMLFDYRLERERYTHVAETFMDIYISVAIAAPMIFLMIFIIIGATGISGGIFNLGVNVLSILLMLMIVLLNIVFLIILQLKQPPL
ncbi:MAG: type II secretion system F family protein, partial [Nanoarchaeota archaeon]